MFGVRGNLQQAIEFLRSNTFEMYIEEEDLVRLWIEYDMDCKMWKMYDCEPPYSLDEIFEEFIEDLKLFKSLGGEVIFLCKDLFVYGRECLDEVLSKRL